jgi:protein-L-isoaspartate(D-aspartate) O-methyltransferase
VKAGLEERRRFYAEELQAVCALASPELVEALATVPRERFLPLGPWTVQGDFLTAPRITPDADARHVYHDLAVALDPARRLFNGQPGTIVRWIDALAPRVGARILHVGCGTGYYTAVMAECVGTAGRVLAVDVDGGLAAAAGANLASWAQVEVRAGTAGEPLGERFDAVLVNAGVTHPLEVWLDALAPAGRMVLPLTLSGPAGDPIGRGLAVALTADGSGDFAARVLMPVAIYSAVGIRNAEGHDRLRSALARSPFPSLARFRRDAHDSSASCWLHGPQGCLATAETVESSVGTSRTSR